MKNKENRKIPDLVFHQVQEQEQQPFESLERKETENYTCFGITKKDTRSLALKVILSISGSIVLIQYSRMLSPIACSNEIKIDTQSLRLVIKGLNLKSLMDYLGEQRLAWIEVSSVEGSSDFIMMKSGEPDIRKIEITANKK